jgi:hypothetical protein
MLFPSSCRGRPRRRALVRVRDETPADAEVARHLCPFAFESCRAAHDEALWDAAMRERVESERVVFDSIPGNGRGKVDSRQKAGGSGRTPGGRPIPDEDRRHGRALIHTSFPLNHIIPTSEPALLLDSGC